MINVIKNCQQLCSDVIQAFKDNNVEIAIKLSNKLSYNTNTLWKERKKYNKEYSIIVSFIFVSYTSLTDELKNIEHFEAYYKCFQIFENNFDCLTQETFSDIQRTLRDAGYNQLAIIW